jgi:hypothetical protein
MKSLDKFCVMLGGISVGAMGIGFLIVCIQMIFTHNLPDPTLLFIPLFGIIAAMMIYAGGHLINGDL